jgi:hypothetical protein
MFAGFTSRCTTPSAWAALSGAEQIVGEALQLVAGERAAHEPGGEGLAVHEFHHIVEEAVFFPGVVDGDDGGMFEPGEDPAFVEEALGPDCGGQLRTEDLDGDDAVQLGLPGGEHHPHAPLATSRWTS